MVLELSDAEESTSVAGTSRVPVHGSLMTGPTLDSRPTVAISTFEELSSVVNASLLLD